MKRVIFILSCLTKVIKKKIFKSQKTEICHECEKLFNLNDNSTDEELVKTEEYLENYNVTTRWQTL
ncbi:MAG: hypothetical protein KAH68_05500 [Draconibacterium sp.]|nr:hypothetical protein [Draconibacterium sp.]